MALAAAIGLCFWIISDSLVLGLAIAIMFYAIRGD